jgi:hypothetical protein
MFQLDCAAAQSGAAFAGRALPQERYQSTEIKRLFAQRALSLGIMC